MRFSLCLSILLSLTRVLALLMLLEPNFQFSELIVRTRLYAWIPDVKLYSRMLSRLPSLCVLVPEINFQPAGALFLPASVVCKIKADSKQTGHDLVHKSRLVVQHSKKRFPSTDLVVVHATVATAKNANTVWHSAHIDKPRLAG